MLNFAPFLVMIWFFGFTMRIVAQTDEARMALAQGRIDRKPPWHEFFMDAALWWMWMAFDFGRWITGKM